MCIRRRFPKAAPRRRAAALVVLVAFAVTLVPGATLAKGPPWARSGDGDRAWMPYGQAKKLGWLFPDVADAAWAATRLEVIITALRLLGLETDATRLDEAVSRFLARMVPKGVMKHAPGWALGYVLLAVREGLIVPEGRLNLMKPASRLEAAVILVRALGKDAEARARAGEALGFTDAAQVPAGAAGYVLIAVEEGILTGYPDGSLRPNKPVTRAELAAVLSRLADGRIPASWFTGTLVSVTAGDAPAMTVRQADGSEASYPVRTDAPVFLDNRAATLADLRPGDQLRLYLDAEGKVVLVRATVPKSTVTGWVYGTATNAFGHPAQITLRDAAGALATYAVSGSVEVYEGTTAVAWSSLRAHDKVELSRTSGTVTRITVLARADTFAGTITALDATAQAFTVQQLAADGVTTVFRSFAVTPDTYMVNGSTAMGFADLALGRPVFVAAHAVSGVWQAVYVELR